METKVKVFTGDIDNVGEYHEKREMLEDLINNWLKANESIELIEIQYLNVSSLKGTALILYKS